MNKMVSQYLARSTKKMKEELLDSLGLFEYEKEYAPEDVTDYTQAYIRGYDMMESDDGVEVFYKTGKKVYPEISDEEFRELINIARSKTQIKAVWYSERVRPAKTRNSSPVAKLLKGFAWFYWIGGFLASIGFANVTRLDTSGYYAKTVTEFSWLVFFACLLGFAILGIMLWSIAEVVADIRRVANAVEGYTVDTENHS